MGRISYYVYVASCMATILADRCPQTQDHDFNPWNVLSHAGGLIWDAATGQWSPLVESARRLVNDPSLLIVLISAFVISGLLAYYVDHTRDLAFHDSGPNSRGIASCAEVEPRTETVCSDERWAGSDLAAAAGGG